MRRAGAPTAAKRRQAAAAALAVALGLLVSGADAADCTGITPEATCEATEGCYWANWASIGTEECRPIPTTNAECECSLGDGNCIGDPPGDQRSGCEPRRFCVFNAILECELQEVNTDDDCRQDGNSCSCVPSEYCNTDCRSVGLWCTMKTTPAPTTAPTPGTPKPTLAPTNRTAAAEAENALLIPIAAGGAAGGCFLIAVAVFVAFMVRRDKDQETKQIRGIISVDAYMSYAKPVVPKLPERQSLSQDFLERLEGMNLVVIYDFEAENDDELGATAGTELLGLLRYDEWWEARTADGQQGIIPCNYVSEVGLTDGIVDPASLEAFSIADF